MAGTHSNDNSAGLDQGTSHRLSLGLPTLLTDDDDFYLQSMGIADGFRPDEGAQNDNPSHSAHLSVSSLEPPVARAVTPRSLGMSKPQPSCESLAIQHDGSESPYNGPTAPSHPYQMYPQGVQLARTASLATTSTAPVSEGSYSGHRRPVRPYEDGSLGRILQRGIDIGFPSGLDRYERRIGPDGEDVADMIGPLGHTEQLPPYTKYPMAHHTLVPPVVPLVQPTPTQPPALQVPQPCLQIPGAGGIGLATQHPEFSTEDLTRLNSPESRRSVRSFASDGSTNRINPNELPVTNEKETSRWRAVARRKVWGVVPTWAIGLGVFVVVVVGAIVGGVVGTYPPDAKKHPPHDMYCLLCLCPFLLLNANICHRPPYNDTTPNPGFIPLDSVPPDLPPLEEGQFILPLINPRYSNNCLKDPNQGHAWNCDAIMAQLSITVTHNPEAPDLTAYALDLQYNSSYTLESYVYSYGVQPPSLHNQQLRLVTDVFQSEKGPAWAFAVPYNKTIILPRLFLSSPQSDKSGRDMQRRMYPYDFKRKNLAQAGDRPWICTWPATTLEVFIYPDQDTNPPSYPLYGSTVSGATSTPTETPTSVHDRTGIKHWHDRHSALPIEEHHYTPHGPPPLSTPSPTPSTSETHTSTSSAPSGYFSHPPMPAPLFPYYPKQIKIEERRDPQQEAPAPTCRQVEIVGDGQEARPVLNDKHEPVVVEIDEVIAEYGERPKYRHLSSTRHFFDRREGQDDMHPKGVELSDCGCIWWIT